MPYNQTHFAENIRKQNRDPGAQFWVKGLAWQDLTMKRRRGPSALNSRAIRATRYWGAPSEGMDANQKNTRSFGWLVQAPRCYRVSFGLCGLNCRCEQYPSNSWVVVFQWWHPAIGTRDIEKTAVRATGCKTTFSVCLFLLLNWLVTSAY